MFYVYEWFITNTNEIIYVGKGSKNRFKVKKHNRFFDEMIKRFNCQSRIYKYFETEEQAFECEYQRIMELKSVGQCVCNINKGGSGGVVSWWTAEKRKYYSEYNVMKSEQQRKRMSENNPMKNKSVAQNVSKKHRRSVVIDGRTYVSVKDASLQLGVTENTVISWCRRGYNTDGKPCRYYDEEQKEYPIIKKINPRIATYKSVIVDDRKFLTVKDGAEYIGVWSETLIRAIKENRKCKGHICYYDNQ